jgi:LPS export ABC transporter permease LptG
MVLYVNDIDSASTHWKGVFLAGTDKDVSRLTLAEEAIVIADQVEGKLELHLRNGSIHEFSTNDPDQYSLSAFGQRDWSMDIRPSEADHVGEPGIPGRTTAALWNERHKLREASVELQRRLAFPFACISFALLAVPIGARPRRGGRAGGFLITLLLITGYYLLFTLGAGLARQGTVPVWVGIWTANVITAAVGLILLPTLERMPGSSPASGAWQRISGWRIWSFFSRASEPPATASNGASAASRIFPKRFRAGVPQVVDLYLLRTFIYYFFLLTVGFIVLFEVFTFFELLEDIAQHHTGSVQVVQYFLYLACYMFYQLAPLGALVAVLVTLGVMTKNNELVAFKASGLSLYRIALPLLLVGVFLAGGLLVLDDTYLPYANQRQDELRNLIKGRPAQTYYQPNQRWIFGENAKIYNYEFFDPDQQLFGGLNVFELDPKTFQIHRRVYASRAHWNQQQGVWVLESGWIRDFDDGKVSSYTPFIATALSEISEEPGYFRREVRQYYQMNWWELQRYISELSQAGFDVGRLSVQLQKKLSFPLIAPIIILLAIPFSILVGTRGAVGGVALGVGIAIVYWAAAALTEAMGAVGQLPPLLAAWAPDTVFAFIGMYFFLKMPT